MPVFLDVLPYPHLPVSTIPTFFCCVKSYQSIPITLVTVDYDDINYYKIEDNRLQYKIQSPSYALSIILMSNLIHTPCFEHQNDLS